MHRFKWLSIFVIFLCSCVDNQDIVLHNYHEVKDSIISWNSIFSQSENNYLVYFYSERCGHCNEIKQDIIAFCLEDIYPMYFVCTDFEAVFGPYKNLIDIDCIKDFYIFGTPFMVRLISHKVESYYSGSKEVKEFISILN